MHDIQLGQRQSPDGLLTMSMWHRDRRLSHAMSALLTSHLHLPTREMALTEVELLATRAFETQWRQLIAL